MTTAGQEMKFTEGAIDGVKVYELIKHYDDRGWLAELFRHDEVDAEFHPVMAYISFTTPGGQRGPHEHVDQADLFCFIGPSTFDLRMWDHRPDSPTFGNSMKLMVGIDNPKGIIIPKGVVHAYKNVGDVDGMVINCPNRLYMGHGKCEHVDEIRHEDDPNTIYEVE